MANSKKDLIHQALTHAGIIGVGETVAGEDFAVAERTADALFEDLKRENGRPIDWDLENIPDGIFLRFYTLLSADLSPIFSVPPRVGRGIAWARLRGAVNQRPDTGRYDYNSDGTVNEYEQEARRRATFY